MRAPLTASLAALVVATALPTSWAADATPALLGLGRGGMHLVRYDPLTLRPVRTGARVGVVGWPWRRSPDGTRVALSSDAPGPPLVVFDATRLRREARIPLGVANPVAIAWPQADRILVVGRVPETGEAELAAVDVARKRVVRRGRLFGRVLGGDVTADGLALLLGPQVGIGRTRLVLVDDALRVRSLALPRTRAGAERRAMPGFPPPRLLRAPGVAVDSEGDRAWVVTHDQPLAEVDLRTGAVRYGPLRLRRPALATKWRLGSTASALWLGDGQLAVTGLSFAGRSSRGLGLWIVDVRSGAARLVDPYAESVERSGDLLVTRTEIEGVGVFDLHGNARPRVLRGLNVAFFAAAGRRGLVQQGAGRAGLVVDLATGRVVSRARWVRDGPPWFLLGDGSAISP